MDSQQTFNRAPRLMLDSGSAHHDAALFPEDPSATLDEAQKTLDRSDIHPAASYLEAVSSVQNLIRTLSLEPSNRRHNSTLDDAQDVLQNAMSRLEDEFRDQLQKYSESVDPDWLFDPVANPSFGSLSVDPSFGSMSEDMTSHRVDLDDSGEAEEEVATSRPISNLKLHIDMLPPEIVPDLNEIAVSMIGAGYKTECCNGYIQIRKATLEESLIRFGLERRSIEDVQKMSWEDLEGDIVNWLRALKVSVGVLFPSEKRLCEEVFEEFPSDAEWCFAEIGKGAIMQLLNFGEAVAIGRRSPEKLSRILDMYEDLRDHLPDIVSIFSGAACENLRSDALDILNHLGEAARGTFAEFEIAIKRDTARNPIAGGAVHPVTRYVMNYLRLLSCFSNTLNQILGDQRSGEMALTSRDDENNNSSGSLSGNVGCQQEDSPLSIRTTSLMGLLEDNLDGKSKLYRDTALSYLFLMNNYHYIVQKVRASEVRTLLSDEWLKRHMSKVRKHHSGYLRAAWTRAWALLKDEGMHGAGSSFSSGVSKTVLKERFKAFNAAFEETVKTHQGWIVFDPQLRDDLRISIVEMLLPAYRNFLGRFLNYLDSERHPERYYKYSAEVLESILNDLFEDAPASVHRRWSFSNP